LTEQQIGDIGEQGLLKRLQAFCPHHLIGDDAAVLTVDCQKRLVVTADVLVDGVHFSDRTTSPEDAGWRAVAANLSDLAAMGATPLGITVALGLPKELSVDWVERLYQGMTKCLQQYGGVIVGGDLVRSPTITVAITAFGEVHPDYIIRRSAAQPNWAIVATGYHGSSRAGLELLLHPENAAGLSPSDREFLIQAHQRPHPRLLIPPLIFSDLTPVLPIAGMDSSDGLADAVVQICRASGVGAKLEHDKIPISPLLNSWVLPEHQMDWALFGGEDFELVLCLPLDSAQKLVDKLGGAAVVIGMTTIEQDVCLVDSSGHHPNKLLNLEQGFQHFKTKSV
jgi:thiamine-monophosphate kinase